MTEEITNGKNLGEFLTTIPGYVDKVDESIGRLRLNFEKTKQLLDKEVSNENFNEAFQNFYDIISVIPLLKNFISIPQIVRARPNYNGEMFKVKSDISYNLKNQDRITLGRFNRQFEPMFYGSLPVESSQLDYTMSCALECCKELIDQLNPPSIQDFTVSSWIVEKKFEVVNLCFNEKHLKNNESLKQSVEEYLNAITAYLSLKSSEFIKEFLMFYSELSSKLVISDRFYYVLTALFVAVRYYYKTVEKQRVYGLIYPSAMTESEGLNIVLTRYAVDNFLKLDKVIMYRYFLERSNNTFIAYPCSDMVKVIGESFDITGFIPQGRTGHGYF